jgi:hypothetical protein
MERAKRTQVVNVEQPETATQRQQRVDRRPPLLAARRGRSPEVTAARYLKLGNQPVEVNPLRDSLQPQAMLAPEME